MNSVQDVLAANIASKAAGNRLLQELPWQQTMQARFRSLMLLAVIAAAFWPTFWSVVAICVSYHTWMLWYATWRYCRQWAWAYSGVKDKPHQLANPVDNHQNGTTANGQHAAAVQQQQQQHLKGRSLPVSLSAVAQSPAGAPVQPATGQGTAIVTGGKMTKALHVCRTLHAAGWRVVLVETHKYWHVGARFSNSVDVFKTVPVPELHPEAYKQAIKDIVRREGASLFIPVSSPIASLYDALAAEDLAAQGCRCWTLSPDMTALLDNKARFSDYAASLQLSVPDHQVVSSAAQLRALNNAPEVFNTSKLQGMTYILKNLAYDSVHRADLFKLPCAPAKLEAYLARPDISISSTEPWILQEFIQGKEYSCYTLVHEGCVVAHADTAAELSNLNYSYESHPGIQQWVEQFAARSGVTGQLCFDFIESSTDGQLYCIECNPRTSSVITEFHDNPQLATAFTNSGSVARTVYPLPASRPTYWWFNEVSRLVNKPVGYLWPFLVVVSTGVDAVFDASDPLPFLALHFLQIPVLLLHNVWRGNPWTKVDLCIGKIAELYGD